MGDPQFSFDFQAAAAPQRRIFKVRELVTSVRTHLERSFPDVWVDGEISNFRPADSGHLYLTLKDGDAQLKVVMFRSQARLLRFRPQNGMQVIVRGRITMYESRGELQILAEYMEPMGAGALQVAFEQLKARLAAEGLFDQKRKKPIPSLPKSVGVVTSARGAAIQDMINVLRRRHESVNILIFPAQVQGETAAAEVASGVRYFNSAQSVDVIVVARGGGSAEDLAAFNDEALARTVAASKIPVISAVGHETDFSICDFVADLRAPTPSAAAEIVIRSKQELTDRVAGLHSRLVRAARYTLLHARNLLTGLEKHGAFARMQDAIARRQQRVDDLTFRLETIMHRALHNYARRLELASARLQHQDLSQKLREREKDLRARMDALTASAHRLLMRRRARWQQAHGKLEALSPLSILDRGYSLVFDANGALVKDASQLHAGDTMRARFARGDVTATVDQVQEPE